MIISLNCNYGNNNRNVLMKCNEISELEPVHNGIMSLIEKFHGLHDKKIPYNFIS